jgi:dienelactone hydrolase
MRILLLVLLMAVPPLGAEESPSPTWRQWDCDVVVDGAAVPLRIRAPATPQRPCPVILFSHGLAGSREGYDHLTAAWAAAGFFVVQPSHAGSDTDAFRSAGLNGLAPAMRAALLQPEVARSRPRLISRLIDLLPQLQSAATGWPGTLAANRIGVAGHSFGAWTAQAVSGVRFRLADGSETTADARPVAFLALSPNGPGPLQPAAAWDHATRPMLLVTGTEDRMPAFLMRDSDHERGPAWREQAFHLVPAGEQFLAVFAGAHHCAFSAGQGARLTGEPMPEPWIEPALLTLTTTWWQARLEDDPVAVAAIRSGTAVPADARSRVRWESR